MNAAGQRATQGRDAVAYAGDVLPLEAWEQLKRHEGATLIDVRTQPEWSFSGEPDLSSIGKKILKISWRFSSPPALNDQFCASIKATGIPADAPLFFLCRSGGRSRDAAAAMTAQGFTHCYNISNGFEGPPDAAHQRGNLEGWKASHLPWRQD